MSDGKSDTPRTDAQVYPGMHPWPQSLCSADMVCADFARELERDLVAAQSRAVQAERERDTLAASLASLRAEHDRAVTRLASIVLNLRPQPGCVCERCRALREVTEGNPTAEPRVARRCGAEGGRESKGV